MAIKSLCVAKAVVGVNFPITFDAGGVFRTSHAKEVGLKKKKSTLKKFAKKIRQNESSFVLCS